MVKRLIACLLFAICLLAAGCWSAEKAQETPLLLEYRNMVINSAGEVILERPADIRQSYIISNEVLRDCLGNPCYALQTENHFLVEPPNKYEPPNFEDGEVIYWNSSLTGRTFHFYDRYGELVQTVDIQAETPYVHNVWFYFAASGNLQDSVFLVDQTKTQGRYRVLNYAGYLLVEKQLTDCSSVGLILAPGFVALKYSAADGQFVDFYTLDGEPMPTAHEYFDCEQLSFNGLLLEERRMFYKARYTNEQGRRRYDILDGSGNVVIGNLLSVDFGIRGFFPATQGWGNLISGWLDLRGGKPVWLAEEPPELDYSYRESNDESIIAAMQTERQYRWIYRIEFAKFGSYYLSPYFWGAHETDYCGDVLDENGNVLISNVERWKLDYLGGDIFAVEKGFSRGLMNVDGEWIYKESIFDELED